MTLVQRLKNKIKRVLNNPVINGLLVRLGVERMVKSSEDFWKNYTYASGKTEQEIAGYSHEAGIQVAIDSTHKLIQECFTKNFGAKAGATVLDIGCGPGLYLKDFVPGVKKYGVDLSTNMLAIAKKNNPGASFFEGHFLNTNFGTSFDFIYTVGVLQYFTPAQIKPLFKKAYDILNPGGILLISYPHAISKEDLAYPDMNYLNYSPDYLNKMAADYFNVIQNKHVSQDRSVGDFDHSPVPPPKGFDRTYLNSSIFIGQKKS